MGAITYLEDPGPGETAVRLMVEEDLVDSLKMYCRGGDGCCGPATNRLCEEGEGDCDHDDQCAGVLQCGTDNCATKVRSSPSPPLSPPSLRLTTRVEDTGTTLTTAARPDVPLTDSVSRAGVPAPPVLTVREVRTDTMSVTRLA